MSEPWLRELRERMRSARRALEPIVREAAQVHTAIAQLAALRGEPAAGLGPRLDALTGELDAAAIGAHLAAAVRASTVILAPVPHAVVQDFLPVAVHQAAVAALPPRPFLVPGRTRMEMPMPPARAPVDCLVVWRCLTAVLTGACGPLMVDQFRPVLDAHVAPRSIARAQGGGGLRLVPSQGRLLLRLPGFQPRPPRPHPWHFLTVVLHLGADGAGGETGSVVLGSTARIAVPYQPNTAVVVFDPGGAHEYAALPETSPVERWSYEFPIGPDGESRTLIGAPL